MCASHDNVILLRVSSRAESSGDFSRLSLLYCFIPLPKGGSRFQLHHMNSGGYQEILDPRWAFPHTYAVPTDLSILEARREEARASFLMFHCKRGSRGRLSTGWHLTRACR
jgi:hypothetical protein